MTTWLQGTAFVHNLIAGYMHRQKVLDRATPYHFAHSTQAAGCAVVYSGDDRLVNNLYAGMYHSPNGRGYTGGAGYNDCTTAEEYPRLLEAEGNTDEAKFYKINQPVYASGNVYAGCAEPFRGRSGRVPRGDDQRRAGGGGRRLGADPRRARSRASPRNASHHRRPGRAPHHRGALREPRRHAR